MTHCYGITERESTSQVALWFVNEYVIKKDMLLEGKDPKRPNRNVAEIG